MKEDSYAEKVWRSWFPRRADENEVRALVTKLHPSGTTEELVKILSTEQHEVGFVERRVGQWLGRVVTDADTKMIEAIARKMKAGSVAVQNAIELREKWHELSQLEDRLKARSDATDRAEELARVEHDTKLLELEARKAEIARRLSSEAGSILEEKRAQLEIKKIEAQMAELEQSARPAPPPPDRMERVLGAVEAELAKKRKEHAGIEATAAWLRARLGADIEFLRSTGKEREAEGLELYLERKLDNLESEGEP